MTVLEEIRKAGGRAFLRDGKVIIRRLPNSKIEAIKSRKDELRNELELCEEFGEDPRGDRLSSFEMQTLSSLKSDTLSYPDSALRTQFLTIIDGCMNALRYSWDAFDAYRLEHVDRVIKLSKLLEQSIGMMRGEELVSAVKNHFSDQGGLL